MAIVVSMRFVAEIDVGLAVFMVVNPLSAAYLSQTLASVLFTIQPMGFPLTDASSDLITTPKRLAELVREALSRARRSV